MVRERRGARGLRGAAAEIGVSAPTLSRVENGQMPDLHTFGLLCRWLGEDPATMLEVEVKPREHVATGLTEVHLRAKRELAPETALALAHAILQAEEMLTNGV